MAVKINGQNEGPIKFTDDKAGKSVFIGPNNPVNPTDGDIWVDSDILNNAGKNLVASVALSGAPSINLSIISDYKDLYVVFRGVQTSVDSVVKLILNNNSLNYAVGTSLFEIVNYKGAVSTNHFSVEIIDTQDTSSFAWGYLKGVYTNSSSVVTILDSTNAFTQAAALTNLTIQTTAGTFTGGTALVYGVN